MAHSGVAYSLPIPWNSYMVTPVTLTTFLMVRKSQKIALNIKKKIFFTPVSFYIYELNKETTKK